MTQSSIYALPTSPVKIVNNSTTYICFENSKDATIKVTLENISNDTIFSFQLNWLLSSKQEGTINWTGIFLPHSTIDFDLKELKFNSIGFNLYKLTLLTSGKSGEETSESVSIPVIVKHPFVLDDFSDTTICFGGNFDLELPAGYKSYQWNTGETSRSISVSDAGIYQVTVTNNDGCKVTKSVHVNEHEKIKEIFSSDTILCYNATLTPKVPSQFTAYKWLDTDEPDLTIYKEGSYVLSVKDSYGCTYLDTLNVEYSLPISLDLPEKITFCENDLARISVNSIYTKYEWSTGETRSSIIANMSGIYAVTVIDDYECEGIDFIEINFNKLPVISIKDSIMCNYEPIQLDVGEFPELVWSMKEGLKKPIVYSPGIYGVSVTDVNGCVNSRKITVENINVSVSLGADTSICEGDGAFVILKGYDSYLWSDEHEGSSAFIGEAGVYAVTVTNNGCQATDNITVAELRKPIANFSEEIFNTDVNFVNESNVDVNVRWDFGDDNYSIELDPKYSYSSPGLYQIKLIVENVCGADSITKRINMSPLAIQDFEKNMSLNIYPTIVSERVCLEVSGLTERHRVRYSVFDVTGKLVSFNDGILEVSEVRNFDTSNFSKGMYFVKVIVDDKLLGVKQFIKY